MKRLEDALQRSVVDYLRILENQGRLKFFAIPNSGKRSKIEAAIMKGLGVRAGVPDICVLIANGPTLFLELKAPNGRVSKFQDEWASWLNTNGFDCRICDTLDGVINTVNWGLKQSLQGAA